LNNSPAIDGGADRNKGGEFFKKETQSKLNTSGSKDEPQRSNETLDYPDTYVRQAARWRRGGLLGALFPRLNTTSIRSAPSGGINAGLGNPLFAGSPWRLANLNANRNPLRSPNLWNQSLNSPSHAWAEVQVTVTGLRRGDVIQIFGGDGLGNQFPRPSGTIRWSGVRRVRYTFSVYQNQGMPLGQIFVVNTSVRARVRIKVTLVHYMPG